MDGLSAVGLLEQEMVARFGLSAEDATDVVSQAVLVVCLKWGP